MRPLRELGAPRLGHVQAGLSLESATPPRTSKATDSEDDPGPLSRATPFSGAKTPRSSSTATATTGVIRCPTLYVPEVIIASSFCLSWDIPTIPTLDAVSSGRCNCAKSIGLAGRFMHYLQRRLPQRSFIARRSSLPSSQHLAELTKSLDSNQWTAQSGPRAVRVEHPGRQSADRLIGNSQKICSPLRFFTRRRTRKG